MKTIKILTEFKGYNCSVQYDVNFKYHTNDKGEKCFFVDNYSLVREYVVECFDLDIVSNFHNNQTTVLKMEQISDEPSIFDSLKQFNPKDPWYKIVSETNISKTILNREEKVCIENEVDYDCHS